MGIRCADHVRLLYPKKLALTSPTGGGRSVGIVRSRTKATVFIHVSYREVGKYVWKIMWERAEKEKRFSFRGNADSVRLSIPCLQSRLRGVNKHSFQKLANRRNLGDRNIKLYKCGFFLDEVDIRRAAYTLFLHVNWCIYFPRKLKGQKIFFKSIFKNL